jgi:hypothetical protein
MEEGAQQAREAHLLVEVHLRVEEVHQVNGIRQEAATAVPDKRKITGVVLSNRRLFFPNFN